MMQRGYELHFRVWADRFQLERACRLAQANNWSPHRRKGSRGEILDVGGAGSKVKCRKGAAPRWSWRRNPEFGGE